MRLSNGSASRSLTVLSRCRFPYISMRESLLLIGLLALAAACLGRPIGRYIGLLLVGVALSLPWFIPPEASLLRAVLAIASIWGVARIVDVLRAPQPFELSHRVWHVLALIDTRQTQHIAPAFDSSAFLKAGAYAVPTLLGLWLALSLASSTQGLLYWLLRWAGGVIFFYCFADMVEGLVRGLYRACGIVMPRQHRMPIVSRSVQEFWSARWNRVVGSWLRQHCFLPLARRGSATAGLAAAFFVSALFHAYFTWVAVGGVMALAMCVFFLLQGLFVLFERKTGAVSWPPVLARIWTIVAIIGTSPLFIEPLLRIIQGADL